MDPKVEKLLEGKSDEEKFLAIAYSFRSLLTRPQCNTAPDPPMKDEPATKKKVNREPKYSYAEVSDEEDSSELEQKSAKANARISKLSQNLVLNHRGPPLPKLL